MPTTPTSPLLQPPPVPRASKARTLAALLALAAAAALLELLAGLFLGAFPLTRRAEALAFLTYRPWILVILALCVARWPWRRQAATVAAFLLLAGLTEAFYMRALGNPDPWPEMLRGWAAGALVAAIAIPLVAWARRRSRWWAIAAAVALSLILVLPPLRAAYERLVAPPAPVASAGPKPAVTLMTAMPLIWGEGGAFDPNSRPAAIYTALQQEFTLRPIDALNPASLEEAPLLLLIQPRWLAPQELVALDDWVRRGGRALILTDPRLNFHSDLPLGDIRRPPPTGLLGPLLGHWGLTMETGLRWGDGGEFPRNRWLVTEHAGRLRAQGPTCRPIRRFLADCRPGSGRALVLSDADLVRDELWVGEGGGGASRAGRSSDNPLVVADLLDELAGVERERLAGDVVWRDPSRRPLRALLWALLPLLALTLAASAAAALLRRGRR
ncbi:MAG TPA: Gldg family protein [Allosphingosinicella sp.]|jgi:hypothetical protein